MKRLMISMLLVLMLTGCTTNEPSKVLGSGESCDFE